MTGSARQGNLSIIQGEKWTSRWREQGVSEGGVLCDLPYMRVEERS